MTLMTWTETMSVGLYELDEDHRKLIRIINQLAENAGKQERAETLRQCLYSLMRYAEFHFAREEAVMGACGFPELIGHRKEHEDFTRTIEKIAKTFDQVTDTAALNVNQQLLDFLKNWLNHHIMVIDKSYQPFVINQPAASSAAKKFKASHVWWQS